MLRKEIKYLDYDDQPTSKICHFNLSKPELMDLELKYDGGLKGVFQNIIETQDLKGIIGWLKEMILESYGVREGEEFVKSPELTKKFVQTRAYEALYMELGTDDRAAAMFFKGILPKDIGDTIKIDELPRPQPPLPPT